MKETVEIQAELHYLPGMSQTLEKRVEDLERRFSELSARILDFKQRKKDWRSTVGTLEQDDMTEEAARLGREFRKQQTYDKEIAGS